MPARSVSRARAGPGGHEVRGPPAPLGRDSSSAAARQTRRAAAETRDAQRAAAAARDGTTAGQHTSRPALPS